MPEHYPDAYKASFNTSHVNVYPRQMRWYCQRSLCFNTSHVNVYQKEHFKKRTVKKVSIHPMLMFISQQEEEAEQKAEFQYIPC